MGKIVIIRHARVRDYVDQEVILSQKDIQGLKTRLSTVLSERYSTVCSPAARAIRTAVGIKNKPVVHISEVLTPIKIGDLFNDKLSYRLKSEGFLKILSSFPGTDERIKKKGKEMESLVNLLLKKKGSFLLITHGECIAAYILLIKDKQKQWAPEFMESFFTPNYLEGITIKLGCSIPFFFPFKLSG